MLTTMLDGLVSVLNERPAFECNRSREWSLGMVSCMEIIIFSVGERFCDEKPIAVHSQSLGLCQSTHGLADNSKPKVQIQELWHMPCHIGLSVTVW